MKIDLTNPMLFLSACCVAVPLLAAWAKMRIWDLHERYGTERG